jgi:hypothetical protein
MSLLLAAAINHSTSVKLAEVAFVLILFAGAWLVAAETLRLERVRNVVAGLALAVSGLLLIIATHWGKLF